MSLSSRAELVMKRTQDTLFTIQASLIHPCSVVVQYESCPRFRLQTSQAWCFDWYGPDDKRLGPTSLSTSYLSNAHIFAPQSPKAPRSADRTLCPFHPIHGPVSLCDVLPS